MDSLRIAAADLKLKIGDLIAELQADPRLAEISRSIQALHSIEDVLNEPQTEIEGPWGRPQTGDAEQKRPVRAMIRPDEFYGLEPLEAAKLVLKKFGTSAMFADIVAGIRIGGGDPGNEDKLRISLARSTMEVAKIGNDRFGLLEFFPHIKRGTPGRKKKNGDAPKESDAPKDSPSGDVQDGEKTETPDAGTSGESEGES